MIGIYKIENLINHKVYIGQSKEIETRLVQHKSDLKHNVHHNSYLQRSWNKYGEQNFIFDIVELCSEEQLNEREIYWIEFYGGKNCKLNFNQKDGGKFASLNEESINKIRNTSKGKHYSPRTEFKKGEHHGVEFKNGFRSLNRKKVYQYDLDGNFIKEFDSIKQAAQENNISSSLITMCCKQTIKAGGNYQWRFKKQNVNKVCKKARRKIYQYDLDGNFIKEWCGIVEIVQKMNVSSSNISNCCRGVEHSACGYQWRYYYQSDGIGKVKTNKKIVYQYNLLGELVNKFISLREMNRITGFDRANVKKAIKTNKISYGYYWKLLG